MLSFAHLIIDFNVTNVDLIPFPMMFTRNYLFLRDLGSSISVEPAGFN
jgi:hypothetical protein